MAKNRRKRCIHKYINIGFMEKEMVKNKRIIGPIKEFFKNTIGVILENEENNDNLKRELEVIQSTKLNEGKDYVVKNKKIDKKSSNGSSINRNKIVKNKTVERTEMSKRRNDREIGE